MQKREQRRGRPLHFQDKNRLSAARLLVKVEDDQAWAQIVSEGGPDPVPPKVREYLSGVTRWRRWLDFLIDRAYTGDLTEVEPLLRQIARIGAYDLLVLRTPPHVAVSAAVAVATDAVGAGAGQLANAILRRVADQRDNPPLPSTDDRADDLGVRWSHPTWLVRRWLDRFGEEGAVALMKVNNDRPWFGVRSNPFSAGARPIQDVVEGLALNWKPTPLTDFVSIERLGPLLKAGYVENGSVSVQDVAAAMAVRLMDPQPNETIIDACAAPGGKSTYAAALMENRGRIVAIDRNNVRLRMVRQGSGRQGVRIVDTIEGDFAAMVDDILPRPDRILVDAPCTGLGVLARRPDLRWRKNEVDIETLTRLQDRLLDRAAALLGNGGILVYSTCTIAREENEGRAAAFLERHRDFKRESAKGILPDDVLNDAGAMETLPHVHGVDGAYAVRFRRTSG
jgi:16S rRNA (cytosine967-C5)-methyltransferase